MNVYLNGSYVDADKAMISVNDRGFFFADGVYEVIRVYDGRPFLMDAHMRRLNNGLCALRIRTDMVDGLAGIAEKLLADNGLTTGDSTIYMQVTRGAAPRKHAFPEAGVDPTVYVAAKKFTLYPSTYFSDGVAAVTVPDTRWARCDIKSISLLPNVLANQVAHDHDGFEALFVKDGVVIEGSHSNLFGVLDGTLITYPSCNYILSGISREIVLQLARELKIPTREGAIPFDRVYDAEELFLSGTTTEVMPVTTLDGRKIAGGRPGPITTRLMEAFSRKTRG